MSILEKIKAEKTGTRQLARQIGRRIAQRRNDLGYSIRSLKQYFTQQWNIRPNSVYNCIYQIENGYHLDLAHAKPPPVPPSVPDLGVRQTRIMDYLAALGLIGQEAETILDGIQKIQPKFKFVESDVKPLHEIIASAQKPTETVAAPDHFNLESTCYQG